MPKSDKPMAVYGPKAMKAEADELGSLALMDKKIAEQKAKDRTKMPKKKALKPMAVYGPKAMKAEAEEVASIPKMAKGGSASKRADGCAVKGKTRGKMV